MNNELKATVLICTLSKSPSKSSSELLANELLDEMKQYGVTGTSFRIADHNVAYGVEKDMGEGDGWPVIRESILASNILILATPIWMGQPASVSKVVLERLDAELAETAESGLPSMYGKVAAVAVVGNEDGAHHVSAEVFQSLSDVGFTIPAGGPTYWVGEAMGSTDYHDLEVKPEKTTNTTKILAANTSHLAKLLKSSNYPANS
jgi:multimeric flavodoxin WrbA